jgi:hypothetical protein
VRRLAPGALGLGVFLATCPLLFRGGAGDGDIPVFRSYGDMVLNGQVPYRDFHPEYPPGAFVFFVLPSLGPEHSYLTIFRLVAAAGIVAGIVALAFLVDLLEVPRRTACGALAFAGAAPALLGAFTLRRFDMWPAAICVAVLACLVARRPYWALSLLAVGVVVKNYPIVLLPVALLAVDHARRWRALAAFCVVGIVAIAPFAAVGHGGLYNSVATQMDRHLHLDSAGSSILLAVHRPVRLAFDGGGWSVFGGGADLAAKLQSAAQVIGVAAAAVLFARSRRSSQDLVAASVTTISVAAFAGKVLSPQFLLWPAPLLVLAGSTVAAALFTGALVTTNLLFPDRYGGLLAGHEGEIWLLVARNALLVAALAALLAVQSRRRASLAD